MSKGVNGHARLGCERRHRETGCEMGHKRWGMGHERTDVRDGARDWQVEYEHNQVSRQRAQEMGHRASIIKGKHNQGSRQEMGERWGIAGHERWVRDRVRDGAREMGRDGQEMGQERQGRRGER